MQRSVGVTISAIVALLGSLLALALGMLTLLALATAPTPPPTPGFPGSAAFLRTIRFLVPLFYLLPAAWGITTSIGLFRLRNWARISIIVFAGLLAIFSLFWLLTSFVMFAMPRSALPPGAQVPPNFFAAMGVVMMVFSLAQLGVGIWWLVFFNRARVKGQFMPQPVTFVLSPAAAGTPPPPSLAAAPSDYAPQVSATPAASGVVNVTRRPVSITIIGWYLLVVSLFVPINLFLRTPATLLVSIITGWAAIVYFLAVFGVHVYVGVGLLRMQPVARLTGIAYFVFAIVNSVVFFFAPGGAARLAKLLEIQRSMFPWMSPGANAYPFDVRPFMMMGAGVGLVFVLIPLCFLIINRQAFARTAARAA